MWDQKIYHFKPEEKPSSDRNEIQSEFFVNLNQFPEVLKTLYAVSPLFRDYVQITELRPVRGDAYPLSPAKGRHVMGIHFTWVKDFDNVMKAVEIFKVALKPYEYRVHWGKYFGYLEGEYLQAIYGAELDDLAAILEHYETGESSQYYNKFNSCFGDRHLYERDRPNYDRCLFTHKFEA
jgi:hypothetical protein